jgi:hypothetical protein
MNTTTVTSLDHIEDLTRAYSRERAALADRIGDLETELTAIRRRRLRGIRSALARTQDAQAELQAAVAGAPELFVKPRTVTIDGIRVGIMKGKGKIAWDDDDQVCRLIDRHFAASADTLTRTTRKPVAAALKELNVAELKRIGCRVEETGDQVVVKPQDSELDKLVGRLLDDTASIEDLTLPEA